MSAEYDRLAAAYARHRQCHEGVLRELVSGASLGTESRVLEIGTGTGNYITALCDIVGCRCSGVNPSAAMLEVASERAHNVELVVGRAEKLPFDSASFDFAFCVDVIHHVADRAAMFSEAFRVLTTGGRLCVVTDSEDIIRERFPLAEYFPDTVSADLARYPRLAELREMATHAGFRDWRETRLKLERPLTTAEAYEAKAFSVLHRVPQAAFEAGLSRLKADLERGPLLATGGYLLVWVTK